MVAAHEGYVAECFWPDVEDADLAALDRRIEGVLVQSGRAVRYLGSLLLRDDEVVLCRFEGAADHVREVAERAAVPFDRLLAVAHSPWPISALGGTE